jgi:hypothetical protein
MSLIFMNPDGHVPTHPKRFVSALRRRTEPDGHDEQLLIFPKHEAQAALHVRHDILDSTFKVFDGHCWKQLLLNLKADDIQLEQLFGSPVQDAHRVLHSIVKVYARRSENTSPKQLFPYTPFGHEETHPPLLAKRDEFLHSVQLVDPPAHWRHGSVQSKGLSTLHNSKNITSAYSLRVRVLAG